MSSITWLKDVDAAFKQAKSQNKPVLLDFSAAPAWSGCARLEAEVYPNQKVAQYISGNFVPVTIHIKEQPQTFERFKAKWTPTILVMDAEGNEHHRLEGFMDVEDYLAQLELGLAKMHFDQLQYHEAEKLFRAIYKNYPKAGASPESVYWAGVSAYKASKKVESLVETGKLLKELYPESEWSRKSEVWLQ